MARTIEPVFSKTDDPRFLKMTFAVHDSEGNIMFPISPKDFEGMEDLTDEEVVRAVSNKADALAHLKDG